LSRRDRDPSKYPGLDAKPGLAAMVVPILIQGVLVGVLNVSQRSGTADYDNEDLKALQVFAENVGTRIRHAQEIRTLLQRIDQLEARLGEEKDLGQPVGEDVLPES
jgi:GAF domain-containing protein